MSEDIALFALPFTVVDVTSEEVGYEASTLSNYFPDAVGWQSNANQCSDTQAIVLRIQHEDDMRMVHALEILCHGT
jgi:hypothetical protein